MIKKTGQMASLFCAYKENISFRKFVRMLEYY